MNVLLTFDDNYSQHAGVVMTSFCINNVGENKFYVISDYISNDNKNKLIEIAHRFDSDISFLFISKEQTIDFPIGRKTANSYVSIATYFRLFLTEVLPDSIDKILYIDCDVIVNSSLDGLWNSAFEPNHCIIALEESPTMSISGCKRLHYPAHYSYFNAGVLLIDLSLFKKFYHFDDAVYFITHNNIIFHDQDVLNGMLYDKKQFMDLKYNVMDYHLIRDSKFPQRYQKERNQLFDPVIIHYSGPIKPWHKECKNPYTYKYYQYLQETPWKDYIPQYKYEWIKPRTIHLIKSLVKWLLDTFRIKRYSFITVSQ